MIQAIIIIIVLLCLQTISNAAHFSGAPERNHYKEFLSTSGDEEETKKEEKKQIKVYPAPVIGIPTVPLLLDPPVLVRPTDVIHTVEEVPVSIITTSCNEVIPGDGYTVKYEKLILDFIDRK